MIINETKFKEYISKLTEDIIEEKQIENYIDNIVKETIEEYRGVLSEAKDRKKKHKKPKKDKNGNIVKTQQMASDVRKLLRDNKFNMTAIGEKVFPDMEYDTLRSYISKIARGEREVPQNKVAQMYYALTNTTTPKK